MTEILWGPYQEHHIAARHGVTAELFEAVWVERVDLVVRHDGSYESVGATDDGFRASLVEKGLSEKRINNILSVLSKPMKYAVDCELIDKAPRIGLYKVERPEIAPWDFEQYARLLAAAKIEGPDWYAAVWRARRGCAAAR